MNTATTIKQRLHKYIAQHPGCARVRWLAGTESHTCSTEKTALLILRNEGKISLKNGTLTNTAAQPV